MFSWKAEPGTSHHCYVTDCASFSGQDNPIVTSGCLAKVLGCVPPAPPEKQLCSLTPPSDYARYGLDVTVASTQIIYQYNETLGAGSGFGTAFSNGDMQVMIRYGPHPPYTSPARTTRAKRSTNGGASWQMQPWSSSTMAAFSMRLFRHNFAGNGPQDLKMV
jgi:hypothetical protein